MQLTQAQRDFIVKEIESDINDGQVYDYYEFGDLKITWVPAQESYLVEVNGETLWRGPSDIADHIDDLSDQQLVDWFVDDRGCDDWLEECLEEEMLEDPA